MQVIASADAGPAPTPRSVAGTSVRAGWPLRGAGLAYGGDYNAEQWPIDVQEADVHLMQQAGVNLATVGVFSWALLEPREGRFDFGWLDRVVDGLWQGGIRVDLATPTAAPPAWFARAYPDALPVTVDGRRLGIGARESFCPSSPVYRRAARRVAAALAERYASHPALALWHVHNEYGAHTGACYCPTSERAFRLWLLQRYGTLSALNEAWGTTFWGQSYGDWEEITAPRLAPMPVNPAQQLDFQRFSSHEYLECFRLERDAIRAFSPDVPITTNFMATACKHIDLWEWADEVDVVTNDHYLTAEDPEGYVELSMTGDLTRGLAGGRPWLLLEHSTSAVNWQPRNVAKTPGQMRRNALAHIARGSEGAMFFQWRASRFGAEKFHSAMLPQAGTDSRLWRDVVSLGAEVAALDEVLGSTVRSEVAVVWDWTSWWAMELEFRPTQDHTYRERVSAFYRSLWGQHQTLDFVAPTADLAGYRLVVVPSLYLMSTEAAAGLEAYVRQGGHLLVSYFSGIVDPTDTVPHGPYPGLLRDVLGLTIEEFHPLPAGVRVRLDDGSSGDVWSERIVLDGATARRRFTDGPDAGAPAVTRHQLGAGVATYLGTRLHGDDLGRLLGQLLDDAEVTAVGDLPTEVEVVRRRGQDADYLFVINHSEHDATVPFSGTDLLSGKDLPAPAQVTAGDVLVLRTTPASAALRSSQGAEGPSTGSGSGGPSTGSGAEAIPFPDPRTVP